MKVKEVKDELIVGGGLEEGAMLNLTFRELFNI